MTETDPKFKSWFTQEDLRELVEDCLGRDPWVTVYQAPSESRSEQLAWFSAIVPNKQVADSMKETGWDLQVGSARPGFTTYGDSRVPTYSYFSPDEPTPLVLVRYFDNHREKYCELLEEFRLFHNLFHEVATGRYFKADANGDEEEIARVSTTKVEVKLRAVRQFCSVKSAHLALYFDSRRFFDGTLADFGLRETEQPLASVCRPLISYSVVVGDGEAGARPFSLMMGKRLFDPLPIEDCGVAPYDEPPRFEEFTVGTESDGSPHTFTCDPNQLDRRDAEGDLMPFLTPVFFRREVLTKYVSAPSGNDLREPRVSDHEDRGSWRDPRPVAS